MNNIDQLIWDVTYEDTDFLVGNPSFEHIFEMPFEDVVKVWSSEVTRLFQPSQGRVRRCFGAVAVKQIAEDVRGDVRALRGDVRVDVEFHIAVVR